MPKFTRKVSGAEDRQVAAVYEGPEPPDGTYPGILRSMRYRESSKKKTPYWNALVVLDAKDKEGRTVQYDGAPAWVSIWLDGSDVSESREKSAYTAICGKADVDVITDDKVPGDPIVTKVGGVNPNGTRVYVQLRTEYDEEYGSRQQAVWIYPDPSFEREKASSDGQDDGSLDVEAEAKEPPAKRTRKASAKKDTASNVTPIKKAEAEPEQKDELDLDSATLSQIREAATEAGMEVKGVPKAKLIEQLKKGAKKDPSKKNPQDIHNMDEEELSEFVESLGYGPEDFADMSREETVELLVDEEDINPF